MHLIRWAGLTVAVAVAVAVAAQPSDAAPGDVISPAVQIAVRDTLGNTDPNFAGTVSVALGTNPTGAFLHGATTVDAVSGVARFGDLTVDKVGSGFSLVATATGATLATSAAFNVVAPAP